MARVRKDQVLAPDPPRDAGPLGFSPNDFGQPRGLEGRPKPHMSLATKLLKGLFVFEALTLFATTFLGVWIGVTHRKRARTFWIVLAGGVVGPGRARRFLSRSMHHRAPVPHVRTGKR
jgi:hypothetical protein